MARLGRLLPLPAGVQHLTIEVQDDEALRACMPVRLVWAPCPPALPSCGRHSLLAAPPCMSVRPATVPVLLRLGFAGHATDRWPTQHPRSIYHPASHHHSSATAA
jgi:hypothetical protein